MNNDIREKILKYLSEQGGAVTHAIANKFNLTNRQVGAIMGHLSRQGKVQTYTKGAIHITHGVHTKASPMRLSNSYYDVV
jgi:predicted ArsR family transcriptional regulator